VAGPPPPVAVGAGAPHTTMEECLHSLMELDYPKYEVLGIDDGSTDATAQIACKFPVRLLSGDRLGLSGARNMGLEQAQGEFVAYIDADAQADPDWLTYLALALEVPGTAGAGARTPSPQTTRRWPSAWRAPGGPIHVLLDDERAEHVPGCNMAFWRERLLEIGGFDPIYMAAGDDVDVCWKLLDRGYNIRFHPSALVWHRRRASVRAFWRQQLGYGKAEALVERNHPDKFNSLGQATWRGVIYGPTSVPPGRGRVYSGRFGDAPFQRLYSSQNHLDPFWALYPILFLLVLSLLEPYILVMPAAVLISVAAIYMWRGVAIGRRERLHPLRRLAPLLGLLLFLPSLARARTALLEGLLHRLRTGRLRPKASSGWDEADIICDSALFWRARMVSYEAWGTLYLRIAYRPRLARVAVLALAIALALLLHPFAVAGTIAGLLSVLLLEGWIFARKVRQTLTVDPKENSHR
jgi:GT2 family glycosyltransferase